MCWIRTFGRKDPGRKTKMEWKNHFRLSWSSKAVLLHSKCAYTLSHSVMSDSVIHVTHQPPLSMGILQASILEWGAMPSSRGSFQPKDQTQVSHTAGGFFTRWATTTNFTLSYYTDKIMLMRTKEQEGTSTWHFHKTYGRWPPQNFSPTLPHPTSVKFLGV